MQIEHWPLGRFHSWAPGFKSHSAADVETVASAIERFGFRVPILAMADGEVIDGRLRLKAAQHLALPTVPVIVADDLSPEEVKAFRISVNRLAQLAEWNLDLLALELQQLTTLDLSLDGLGFDDKTLRQLLASLEGEKQEAPVSPDRGEELSEKWGTAPGQLWQIGPHRLAIADATKPATWSQLMAGEVADCVFTDPPYGVSYLSASGKHKRIANDDLTGDRLLKFLLHSFLQLLASSSPTAAWYVWHAGSTRDEFILALKAAGVRELQTIIWIKPNHVLGRSDYHWSHEPCIYGCVAGQKPAWHGGRSQSTAWRIAAASPESFSVAVGAGLIVRDGKGNSLYLSEDEPADRRLRSIRMDQDQPLYVCRASDRSDVWEVSRDAAPEHPTQKPAELARRALENSTLPGQLVVDAFLGSGSTMVAAEQTGRVCYGTELSPAYAGVILERLSLLGRKPELTDG